MVQKNNNTQKKQLDNSGEWNEGQDSDQDVISDPTICVAWAQALGHRYHHNEDSLFAYTATLQTEKGEQHFGCFCVADGMGGYENGELASAMAVEKMGEHVLRKIFIPMLVPNEVFGQEPILQVLENGMLEIHEGISQKIMDGGSTMTVAVLVGDHLSIAHVGDTRAYIIREGADIEQITEDQTLVQRLVTLGQMTEEEARNYPQRNVLYYALGRGDNVEPFLLSKKVTRQAYLLLCSDGLWEVVPAEDIQNIILAQREVNKITHALVSQAVNNGAMDNVTALVAKL
ncbi:MAG: serine/threonine-protein phosphatase [Anaerolineae bacterium]|nr:serine/threonine-protein phosphatase [Anaerolineae bacterium]